MRESLQNAVTDDRRRRQTTTTDAAGHLLCSHWTDGPWLQKKLYDRFMSLLWTVYKGQECKRSI